MAIDKTKAVERPDVFDSLDEIIAYMFAVGMKLTPKQLEFVQHYCANGFNGTQAAISAKYAESSAGVVAAQNITKLNIAFCIAEFKKMSAKSCGIDTQWVVSEFIKLMKHPEATPQTMNTTLGKLSEFTGGFDANTRKVVVEGDLSLVPQGLGDFYADSGE